MNISSLDWSLIRVFLAVAESGSLSAAAKTLGTSQPTVGRQIKDIETRLGATLFHRQPRGFELTDIGAALVAPARAMRDAAQQIEMTAAGTETRLEGTVRITASTIVSAFHLPTMLAQFRKEEPAIHIELVPSDDSSNLLYREADIAVRMYRPTQKDLVAKHIGDISIGLFGAKSYLKERGVPRSIEDLQAHDLVGFDQSPVIVDAFRQGGLEAARDWFQTRCDDQIVYWQLVRAGCGLGFSQVSIGRDDPLVDQVDLGGGLPVLPIWLTAHEAMRQTPRIRRVWDYLSDALRPLVS